MSHLFNIIFLCCWTSLATSFSFDKILKGSRVEFESSASGPVEPVHGAVKVVQLEPHLVAQSGFFRRTMNSRRAPSGSSRLALPTFLSQGRPGPAFGGLSHPLHHLQPKISAEPELKKKQGLQMWQRAIEKGDKISSLLPIRLKDTKQTCSAVPFTQRVTAPGCDAVTVHNNLCFGQCSSLFVPPEGEFGLGAHRRSPCSRCAPSKVHTVTVPLKCGSVIRSRKVMVVEECKCETGREENTATAHS